MALTSTLFTGLSGLDVNQTKLNVVANNIANVNTVAFKSSRALFKPQFYVTDSAGSAPGADNGGSNPSQRGLGATVASIEKDFTTGSIEPTGKPTDLALDGDGFFIVKGSQQQFTRDGSFTLNSANQLVTTGGDFVQGFGVDTNSNIIAGSLQNITIPLGASAKAETTSTVELEGNLNSSGSLSNGASVLTTDLMTTAAGTTPTAATTLDSLRSTTDAVTPLFTDGQVLTLSGKKGGRDLPSETYTVGATSTVGDLEKFFQTGMGINTTVPAPTDPNVPTPGVTVEADATNTKAVRLVIAGNTGSENALTIPSSSFSSSTGASPLTFVAGTTAAGIASDPTGESVHTSFVAYDSLGTAVNVGVTASFEKSDSTGNTWRFYAESGDSKNGDPVVGSGTLTFDNHGKLLSSTGTTINVDRSGTGAKTPLTVTLDFNALTSLASQKSEMVMTHQDGSPMGTLNSFSIGADGTITGSYSNGMTKSLGQVAVATFNNPEGLVDNGGNMYVPSATSGVPIVTNPTALGAGAVRSGSLELSNVDLSKEFINMIVATTGFSSASRVITTSNTLLQELLNMGR